MDRFAHFTGDEISPVHQHGRRRIRIGTGSDLHPDLRCRGMGDGVDAPYGIAMCQDGGVETTI